MAGNGTQTDAALMEQTAKQFEAVDAELMAELSRLKQKVTALQAGWVGRGSRSFQQTMEAWSRSQEQINQRLRDTAQLIRSAGRDYQATDANTATAFDGTGGGPVHTGL